MRLRRPVVAALLGLVLIASVGWAYVAATRSPAAPLDARDGEVTVPGNRVLLVGDSLLWAATAQAEHTLQADGWVPTIAATPGTRISDWAPGLPLRVAAAHPDALVVELGTNDCNPDCAGLASSIDQVMRSVAKTVPVYWLDVQTQPTYPTHPETVNRALAEAASHWPNLTIVGMNAHFRNHPEWHVADGLHFDDAGSAQLATLIAGSLPARS